MWVVAVWVNARGLSTWGDAEPRRLMTHCDWYDKHEEHNSTCSNISYFSSRKKALGAVVKSGIKSYGIVEIKHHQK